MHCMCFYDNFIAKDIATYVDIACICYRRSSAFFKQIYPLEHLSIHVSYLFLIKQYLETLVGGK